MKAPRIRAVKMVRTIRDHQTRRLAGKSPQAIIAFYRAAGEVAMKDVEAGVKARRRAG